MANEDKPNTLTHQECPICHKKTLTLMETKRDIPYFGVVYLFSMNCSNCKYFSADVETAEKHNPSRYTFEVSGEEDLNVRVVRASTATIKIPHIITISPGSNANGFITNVEGLLNRVKHQIEMTKESEDDPEAKKKAKKMLKKLSRVLWGQEKLKIIIEDPEGNSAIISEKAIKKKI